MEESLIDNMDDQNIVLDQIKPRFSQVAKV